MYRQVVDGIKELIARGELQQGSALPPVRQVAADLGVNLNTIAVAYRHLQKDGLIRIRHGSGAVVTSRTLGEKADDRLQSQLRSSLTQLVLGGLARAEINLLVASELDHLFRDRSR